MFALLKYQFSHLTDFSGRDARPTFWWWALFLVIIYFALGLILSVAVTLTAIGSAVDVAQAGLSEEAAIAQMMGEMAGSIRLTSIGGIIFALLAFAMGAASFVRRLHDSGLAGWIAFIPLGTQLAASYISYGLIEEMTAAASQATSMESLETAQLSVAAAPLPWSLLSWVGLLVIIICGLRGSSEGPNAYGEAPADSL